MLISDSKIANLAEPKGKNSKSMTSGYDDVRLL